MSGLMDLLKVELQDKCFELGIEFTDDDNKSELVKRILEVEPEAEKSDSNFDRESYDTFVRLTFEKGIRKGGQLTEKENEALAEAKPKAFKNEGRKPLKTNAYRVNMKSINLIEGLPTPEDIVNSFSKEGIVKLFA